MTPFFEYIKKLNHLSRNIEQRCLTWNHEWIKASSLPHFLDSDKYLRSKLSLIVVFKTILGLFVQINRGVRNPIFLEGHKYLTYLPKSLADQIVIIGSYNSKRIALKNNSNHTFAFPIHASIIISCCTGIRIFLLLQVHRWYQHLLSKDSVLIFLDEDTQPVGAFFSIISKTLSNSRSICIQHGYFRDINKSLPVDGSLCDLNFSWDLEQARLIKPNLNGCHVLGPFIDIKYTDHKPITSLIFVGTGENSYNPDKYNRLLNIFSMIIRSKALQALDFPLMYRPHPWEIVSGEPKSLSSSNIELIPKDLLLYKERRIFIGHYSSLLYEAGLCGHVVINILDPHTIESPFKSHANILIDSVCIDELEKLIFDFLDTNPPRLNYHSRKHPEFIDSFLACLSESGTLEI